MFDNLADRMSKVIKNIRGEARLSEDNTQAMLREVRMALLEADVALPVVRDIVARIKDSALGESVVGSLTPGQALIGVVNTELTRIMGGEHEPLNLRVVPPAIILMAGLQGAGKTTTVGKLAKLLKEEQKKRILLVSCDVYRPAAIKQLELLSQQVGVDFFPSSVDQTPFSIAQAAVEQAKRGSYDILFVDTAGRTTVDTAMMQEIAALHAQLNPIETLFVVDAMQGQDAVNTAKAFNDVLPLTGVVLTKLDGDSRGGAALSVREVTGKPIKYIGISEKMNGIQAFHPERMASRILGMGDIVTLVEDVKKSVDEEAAQELMGKFKAGKGFDLNDFLMQMQQMKKMGGINGLLDKLPQQMQQATQGMDMNAAEKDIKRMEAIILSMTPLERSKPELLKASRKRRIAAGAGVQVQKVNQLLAQYEQMNTVFKQFRKGGMGKMMRGMQAMMGRGGMGGKGGMGGGMGGMGGMGGFGR
jgi:signal recognition particle subunit SRP54